jgi:hypothetical protein
MVMVCEHLRDLERAIAAKGIKETYRGQPWSKNCREWDYYDCHLDLHAIRARMPLASCVVDHAHLGTHDGAEAGFICSLHRDGIMGVHEQHRSQIERPTFTGE